MKTLESGAPFSIDLGGETIVESPSEKILGVTVSNDLKWTDHVSKVQSECNYHLQVLRRLRPVLSNPQLRTIAEGIVMSRLRYCLPVIGAEFVRFGDDDSRSGIMQSLQLIQNEMLRIVSGKRRRDHERIADMLENARMLSINQLASYSVLIESWRA